MASRSARVLIDAHSVQAVDHLWAPARRRRRLSAFIEIIESLGDCRVEPAANRFGLFGPTPRLARWFAAELLPKVVRRAQVPLSADQLAACDLLIVTTRFPTFPYSAGEIAAIERFVERGGALLLMANHSREKAGSRRFDFVTQDARLAAVFGVKLLEARFRSDGALTVLTRASSPPHASLCDASGRRVVEAVAVGNCCAVSSDSAGSPILFLNGDMFDLGPHCLSPSGQLFGVAIDQPRPGHGRVAVLADSGFIGEPDAPAGGPGLLEHCDNRAFVRELVAWLLERK